jgi:hypothetical protein
MRQWTPVSLSALHDTFRRKIKGLSLTSTDTRRAAALASALLLASGCSSSNTPPAPSSESPPPASASETGDGVRRNPVVAGRPGRVFVMAGFGEKCESLPAPKIRITQQPAKGSVSFEPGQETTINTSASGTCIGQRVTGTGIYYTARPGETGTDTFAVEAELEGSLTQRTFTVEIVN